MQEELLQLADRASRPSPLDLSAAPAPDPTAPSPARRYRVAFDGDPPVFHFDDGTVVFNEASWDTHYLNDAAAVVLEFIAEGTRTESDVAALMAELLTADEAASAAEYARSILDELAALRLIAADDCGAHDAAR